MELVRSRIQERAIDNAHKVSNQRARDGPARCFGKDPSGQFRGGVATALRQRAAIVAESLWNDVQRRLEENRIGRQNGVDVAEPSLLAGLLDDETGDRLVPTHANKRGRRYRYYVSQVLINGPAEGVRHGRRFTQ